MKLLNRKNHIIPAWCILAICWLLCFTSLRSQAHPFEDWVIQQDTVKQDTAQVYTPSKTPTYRPQYRFGDPFSNRTSRSPLLLKDPSKFDFRVDFDTSGVSYSVFESLNNVNFRPATTLSFREFDSYTTEQINRDYWKDRSEGLDGESAVSGRRLIPKLYISPAFDRIFGGNFIDIQPTGFANLDFGGRWQFVDNPQVPLRQRRNGGFNFDLQLSTNVVGKIGEKLEVSFNFDNNNTFDFQNNLKIAFTGYEEDIIKKIEIGNVSLPVKNSLITGSQSLFGIKTQLQFGKLFVTTIASRSQSRSESITLGGGGQGVTNNTANRGGAGPNDNINIRGSDYDENRHFFLGHFFRDNFESWNPNLEQVTSGLIMGGIEVYVINTSNETETTRNVVALLDLGEENEENIFRNSLVTPSGTINQTDNDANNLFEAVDGLPTRTISGLRTGLNGLGYEEGTDYVVLTSARLLDASEYTINRDLGFISLNRRLQNNEALAVSYEYTINGGTPNRVGELFEDYQSLADEEAIIMKMLRPNAVATNLPSWDLMMKNIYSLGLQQVQEDGFSLRVHYRDDRTGQDNPSLSQGRRTANEPLIEILGLDQLNRAGDFQSDGNFDFVPNRTINTRRGEIIFPVLEPFGSHIASFFDSDELELAELFVYDTLYSGTKTNAARNSFLDKYVILGSSIGTVSSTIPLGFNVSPGSVIVTHGGITLVEGQHYTVNYGTSQLTITDPNILQSGQPVNINFEQADLFNFRTRWLTGADFEFRVNDNFNLGATILNLNERPGGISRFAIGDEPIRNTKYGFNISWQGESNLVTKIIDALPLIATKEPSSITFDAEIAQLVPGTSNRIQGQGTSFIDDFENAATPINLGTPASWKFAATPRTADDRFEGSGPLGANFLRGKMAWYIIDNSVFFRNNRPPGISNDITNNYERAVLPQEIFPQRDRTLFTNNQPIFDIAYYPEEPGVYNYNPDTENGVFEATASRNWGGITRANPANTDFTRTNVEYFEFWLLDPFLAGPDGLVIDGQEEPNTDNTGRLVFNLGSVSEDLLRDGEHAFENGLPADGGNEGVTENIWGNITTRSILVNAFSNDPNSRANQDIGLDGLGDAEEAEFFERTMGLTFNQRGSDISADNFLHYQDDFYDQRNAQILERYSNFNGLEGNSPVSDGGFTPAATQFPDDENVDIERGVSDSENYFEYDIPLRSSDLEVGRGFIIDEVTSNGVTWYQFRIPIQNPQVRTFGNPDLTDIRFIRMYLTGFSSPIVLRMAQFQMVGSQWNRSTFAFQEFGLNEVPESVTDDFDVSVVNIESNGALTGEGIPYVVPPGLGRDRDNTTTQNRVINEQSLQVCVESLEDGDGRAVFKAGQNIDLVNFGRIQMFLNAQANGIAGNQEPPDGEITGFLRLGSDENNNFYEIEVPLQVTDRNDVAGVSDSELARAVWPLENEINLAINELLAVKAARNRSQTPIVDFFSQRSTNDQYRITVRGNPDISNITTLVIGARNPRTGSDNRDPYSFCIWANELRVSDFNSKKGWAANASLNVKLADLGTFSANSRYTSIGFGSIQDNIAERTRAETVDYALSANLNLEKFLFPEKTGLKVPVLASIQRSRSTPQFDPLDPDTPLEASLLSFETEEEREDFRRIAETRSTSRSLNFTNVRKEKVNPEAKSHIYDIENFSFTYAYSDTRASSVTQQSFFRKSVSGAVSYNYTAPTFSIEPFSESKAFNSPYLQLIKDINFSPIPSNLSFRADLNRNFSRIQLFNDQLTTDGVDPLFERLFTFTRSYGFRWNLFKGLGIDYSARVNAVIDEPSDRIDGDIDTSAERRFIWSQIRSLGRTKDFSQDISANYRLPLDKIPFTDWLNADYRYNVGYTWTAGFVNREDSFSNDPPDPEDPNFFGNVIRNRRDQTISGRVDLVKLYNKVAFLKKVNDNSGPRRNTPGSRRPRVPRNGQNEEPKGEGNKFVNGFFRALMSLRSINVNYGIRESTTLPGFLPSVHLFGLDSGFNAPGFGFIFGSQDASIRNRLARNDNISPNPSLTNPFEQTQSTDLTLSADFEPTNDIKIQLDASRTNNNNFREIFRLDSTTNQFRSFSPSRSGSYNISFLTIGTAFEQRTNNTSEAFDQFAENVGVIRSRLNEQLEAEGNPDRFDSLSQDILIPAFLAAYSGRDANNVRTSAFPRIPIPNWRLEFAGLSNLAGLKDIFSSINITHGYRSTYSVSNYTSALAFEEGLELSNSIFNLPLPTETNENGSLTPIFRIGQVTISEQFSPLIGLNVRTHDNLTARLELRRDRNLSLNVTNAQVTEGLNNEVSLDVGWTKDRLKLPWRSRGRTITIENEVTFRMNMSIRDSRTIQRNLEGENTLTNGNKNFQMRPTVGYRFNDKLDLSFYFERSITNPQVGSFRRTTTAFGFQTRFNFAQ